MTRNDSLSKFVMVIYTLFLSAVMRFICLAAFGSYYGAYIFRIRIGSVNAATIITLLITLGLSLVYVTAFNGERTFVEGFWIASIVHILITIVYITGFVEAKYTLFFWGCIAWCVIKGITVLAKYGLYAWVKKRKLKIIKVLARSFRESYNLFREIILPSMAAICLIVIIFVPEIRNISYNDTESTTMSSLNTDMKNLLDENEDELKKLRDSCYPTLTKEERLSALQVLVNCHLRHLQCESSPILRSADMEQYRLGYYNSAINMIVVNNSILMANSSSQVVQTIAHECKHVHQRECVIRYESIQNKDDPLYYGIAQWKHERSNYIEYDPDDPNENKLFYDYANQSCESDANSYAYQWSNEFLDSIIKGPEQ